MEKADRLVLSRANVLAAAAHRILWLCRKQGIPGVEENPAGSFLFELRSRRELLKTGGFNDFVFDMCQFGAEYKKRTRIRAFGWTSRNFVCVAASGICATLGKAHTPLSEIKDKDFATKAAATYPGKFAQHLARCTDNAIVRRRFFNVVTMIGH